MESYSVAEAYFKEADNPKSFQYISSPFYAYLYMPGRYQIVVIDDEKTLVSVGSGTCYAPMFNPSFPYDKLPVKFAGKNIIMPFFTSKKLDTMGIVRRTGAVLNYYNIKNFFERTPEKVMEKVRKCSKDNSLKFREEMPNRKESLHFLGQMKRELLKRYSRVYFIPSKRFMDMPVGIGEWHSFTTRINGNLVGWHGVYVSEEMVCHFMGLQERITGLSEYMQYNVWKIMLEKGYNILSDGETFGNTLQKFKEKFKPYRKEMVFLVRLP